MNLIAAIDKNHGIGCAGGLLYQIPEDLKFFKEKTENKIVVMGHNTLKSLPQGKPLINRLNIVLSEDKNLTVGGATVCNSVKDLFDILKEIKSDDIFVIGGQTIYNMLADYCEYAYITEIDACGKADRFFHKIFDNRIWKKIEEQEEKTYNGIKYKFCKYKNLQLKSSTHI